MHSQLNVCYWLYSWTWQLSLADLLQPAIDLAQRGFPVTEITAYHWASGTETLRAAGRELGRDLLINNQPPKHGQVMTNPSLARTLQVCEIKMYIFYMNPFKQCSAVETYLPCFWLLCCCVCVTVSAFRSLNKFLYLGRRTCCNT